MPERQKSYWILKYTKFLKFKFRQIWQVEKKLKEKLSLLKILEK
jgi:hypothetical protein